jgi:hypothetical protein
MVWWLGLGCSGPTSPGELVVSICFAGERCWRTKTGLQTTEEPLNQKLAIREDGGRSIPVVVRVPFSFTSQCLQCPYRRNPIAAAVHRRKRTEARRYQAEDVEVAATKLRSTDRCTALCNTQKHRQIEGQAKEGEIGQYNTVYSMDFLSGLARSSDVPHTSATLWCASYKSTSFTGL